jgi:hypothetical protein
MYNPVAYQGMQPGALPPMPGMGAALQSYMPSVNGMQGFGGLPASQLVQALMAGYGGVPMAQQPTGAQAPGMSQLPQVTPPGAGTGGPIQGTGDHPPTAETPAQRRRREQREWDANHFNTGPISEGSGAESDGTGGDY